MHRNPSSSPSWSLNTTINVQFVAAWLLMNANSQLSIFFLCGPRFEPLKCPFVFRRSLVVVPTSIMVASRREDVGSFCYTKDGHHYGIFLIVSNLPPPLASWFKASILDYCETTNKSCDVIGQTLISFNHSGGNASQEELPLHLKPFRVIYDDQLIFPWKLWSLWFNYHTIRIYNDRCNEKLSSYK